MNPGTLDVRYLNFYVFNKTPLLAMRAAFQVWGPGKRLQDRPHFVGTGESRTVLALLAKRAGYRNVRAVGTPDQARGIADCTVSVRKDLEVLATLTVRVSEEVEPTKFGPDRWAVLVAALVPGVGPVAYVAFHPNATVRNRSEQAPIVREYRESVVTLEHIVEFCKAEGWHLVLGGDWNYSPHGKQHTWSPFVMLRQHDIRPVLTRGVDSILASRGLVDADPDMPEDEKVFHGPGSDHPGLRVRLMLRRPRSTP